MIISVLIVTFNSEYTIEECLKSVYKEIEVISEPCDVIVVDNRSTDATCSIISSKFPKVRLVVNEVNTGFARGINRASQASNAEYLFLLNPDAMVNPNALKHLLQFMKEKEHAGIVAPRILNEDGTVQLSCRTFPSYTTALFNRYSFLTRIFPENPYSDTYLKTTWSHDNTEQVDWVSGAAMMIRKSLFDRLGGMDERFFLYAEDVDLCMRLLQMDAFTFYHPEAEVTHTIGESSKSAPFKSIIERHKSMYYFYRKHYSKDIALIDFTTFFGIMLRGVWFLGIALLRHIFTGRSQRS